LKGEIDLGRARIREAADAAQRPKLMIERTVFLHQDHDMLDIVDRACAVVGRDRERLRDSRAVGGRYSARAQHFENLTTIDIFDILPIMSHWTNPLR
jgi:hypothetical protein